MAARRANRAGETGLSMMEALVIVTLTALIALMILPLAQQSSRDAVNLSDRELNLSAAERGETAFRELLASASQPRVRLNAPPTLLGNPAGFVVQVSSQGRSTCADAGVETRVSLRIEQHDRGGALVCSGQTGRGATLLTWQRGQAALAYSFGDGWSPNANVAADRTTQPASLVRFSLQAPNLPPLVWVGQAGWTEPARVAPDASAQPATTTQ